LYSVYFATSNRNKYREVSEILAAHSIGVRMGRVEPVEIQADDLETIAVEKAKSAYLALKHDVIVEDNGLFIDSLNGFPGPYSAFVLKTIGNAGILKLMTGVAKRSATFASVIAFCGGSVKPVTFVAKVKGTISKSERGRFWGYDPIFVPRGSRLTYAEMGARKSEVSHRRLALEKFARWYTKT
jgi:XTP/dITP diphosphohydrolase